MAEIMRLVATDVTSGVITNSGHWVMEEQPGQLLSISSKRNNCELGREVPAATPNSL